MWSGASGRRKNATIETATENAPWMMKSLVEFSCCCSASMVQMEIYSPLPSLEAVTSVEFREDRRSDQTREGTGSHVSSVEDRHASCNLLTGVEHADHVQSTWVELLARVSFCS